MADQEAPLAGSPGLIDLLSELGLQTRPLTPQVLLRQHHYVPILQIGNCGSEGGNHVHQVTHLGGVRIQARVCVTPKSQAPEESHMRQQTPGFFLVT